jgi:hypothetical protein
MATFEDALVGHDGHCKLTTIALSDGLSPALALIICYIIDAKM